MDTQKSLSEIQQERETQLREDQQKREKANQTKSRLENEFFALCGIAPSIVSADWQPFASFDPETLEDYIKILTAIAPTEKNYQLTFAGKPPVETFSPYAVYYGGESDSDKYFEVTVKFESELCPVWVKMPKEIVERNFTIKRFAAHHIAFGRYEYKFTLEKSMTIECSVQQYYRKHKTMYAATPEETEQLTNFIFNR